MVTLALASAEPWDLRGRVQRAVETQLKGITLEKLAQQQEWMSFEDVGDIWSDCGRQN